MIDLLGRVYHEYQRLVFRKVFLSHDNGLEETGEQTATSCQGICSGVALGSILQGLSMLNHLVSGTVGSKCSFSTIKLFARPRGLILLSSKIHS